MEPRIKRAKAEDGVNIAYATIRSGGPLFLVYRWGVSLDSLVATRHTAPSSNVYNAGR